MPTNLVESARPAADAVAALKAELRAIVGAGQLRDDAALLALHSEDVFAAAPDTVTMVVQPRSTTELAAVMAAAHRAGVAVAPRGAGMSYTGGYLPVQPDTISLDMTAMDRILNISAEDMVVTVEAGCSWAALDAALAAQGLRTPFWGRCRAFTRPSAGGCRS